MSRTSVVVDSFKGPALVRFLIGAAMICAAGFQTRPVQASDGKPPRVVQFELADEYEHGILPAGQRVGLTIRLLGDAGQTLPSNVVAIVEVPQLGPRLVSLESTENPSVLEARASIELPALDNHAPQRDGPSIEAPPGQPVRVNVTFARLQGMNLQALFKRRLYLTVGPTRPSVRPPEAPPHGAVQIYAAPVTSSMEDHPPAVPGILDEAIIESDLLNGNFTSEAIGDYWREISRRLRHHWVQRDQAVMPGRLVRGPRIHFRLYPGGIPQMIYVERSSGNVRADIAGLESVLEVQAFSPFPAELRDAYVNVHVQFRRERRKHRE
jgi:hypothetical protein